ncbi:low affinity iron permease family protein [Sphingobium yanoikuyae]|uniref:low affinity iron permease family protein n=1 Tax=Sphingobium yanoikuyae TaxID=13690 RepID=UPI0030B8B8DF
MHYSDIWQLIVNTATTVLTFLAVFLIQNSQNRAARPWTKSSGRWTRQGWNSSASSM